MNVNRLNLHIFRHKVWSISATGKKERTCKVVRQAGGPHGKQILSLRWPIGSINQFNVN